MIRHRLTLYRHRADTAQATHHSLTQPPPSAVDAEHPQLAATAAARLLQQRRPSQQEAVRKHRLPHCVCCSHEQFCVVASCEGRVALSVARGDRARHRASSACHCAQGTTRHRVGLRARWTERSEWRRKAAAVTVNLRRSQRRTWFVGWTRVASWIGVT